MDRTFKDSDINRNVFDDILKDDALLDRIKNQPTFKARLAPALRGSYCFYFFLCSD